MAPNTPDRSFNAPGLSSLMQDNPDFASILSLAGSFGNRGGGGPSIPSFDDRANYARSLGYTIRGGNAVRNTGGVRSPFSHLGGAFGGSHAVTTPISSFMPPSGGGGGGGGLPPLLLQALASDTRRMQDAADRQFWRNQGEIDGMRSFVSGIGPGLTGQANSLSAELDALAGKADAMGGQQHGEFMDRAGTTWDAIHGAANDFRAGADRIGGEIRGLVGAQLPKFFGDIESSFQKGDQAVAGFERALGNFEDRTAQDASVVASGIRRNAQAQMQMARSGIHPDGTPMTAAESADMMSQIRRDTEGQVQGAITPIFSQYNMAKAQLEESLAGLRMNNANLRLQGAQLRDQGIQTGLAASDRLTNLEGMKLEAGKAEAEVGLGLTSALVQEHQNQQALLQLSTGLSQTGVQMRQAAMLQAVNLEMQGRTQVAQLVQQNPDTVVSWFQSLLALYSASMASQPPPIGGGGGGGGVRRRGGPFQGGGASNPFGISLPGGGGTLGAINLAPWESGGTA